MGKHRTQRPPPLRCPRCGTGDYLRMIGVRHVAPATDNQAVRLQCTDCKHNWWSRARAAVTLYQTFLERLGQQRLFPNKEA